MFATYKAGFACSQQARWFLASFVATCSIAMRCFHTHNARQTGRHWFQDVQAHQNGYPSAAGIPETPMSPLEEQQGYSPSPHQVAPSPNASQGMPGLLDCVTKAACHMAHIVNHAAVQQTSVSYCICVCNNMLRLHVNKCSAAVCSNAHCCSRQCAQ